MKYKNIGIVSDAIIPYKESWQDQAFFKLPIIWAFRFFSAYPALSMMGF
jgi:hypothetical protein